MIAFKTATLEDKPWIDALLAGSDFMTTEYSFVNLFMWGETYGLQVAQLDGFYLMKSESSQGYAIPVGQGDLSAVLEKLRQDAAGRGWPLRLVAIPANKKDWLEGLFPGRFTYTTNRDWADYLYTAESLRTLAGKKLHGKRNHINRFVENHPDWRYEPIGPENLEECVEMNRQWCVANHCEEDEGAHIEACAAKRALLQFEALGLRGGLLRVEGRVIAYSFGHPLGGSTFDVRVEKAFAEIQGAYPMMNQQFVLHNCDGFEYINREDDTGDEGLRQAKLSYRPAMILEKYTATEVE